MIKQNKLFYRSKKVYQSYVEEQFSCNDKISQQESKLHFGCISEYINPQQKQKTQNREKTLFKTNKSSLNNQLNINPYILRSKYTESKSRYMPNNNYQTNIQRKRMRQFVGIIKKERLKKKNLVLQQKQAKYLNSKIKVQLFETQQNGNIVNNNRFKMFLANNRKEVQRMSRINQYNRCILKKVDRFNLTEPSQSFVVVKKNNNKCNTISADFQNYNSYKKYKTRPQSRYSTATSQVYSTKRQNFFNKTISQTLPFKQAQKFKQTHKLLQQIQRIINDQNKFGDDF